MDVEQVLVYEEAREYGVSIIRTQFRYDIENQVTFDSFGQAILEINLILETRRKAMEKMNEKSKTKVNLPKLKKINKDNGQKKDTN